MIRGATPTDTRDPSRRGRVLFGLGVALWVAGFWGAADLGQAGCGHYVWDRLHPVTGSSAGGLLDWNVVFRGEFALRDDVWTTQKVRILNLGSRRLADWDDRQGEAPCRGPHCHGQPDLPAPALVERVMLPDETRSGMTSDAGDWMFFFCEFPARDWMISERRGTSPLAEILKPPCE